MSRHAEAGVLPFVERTRTLVIGWGNPLRGDDGAGVAVAEALLQRPRAGREVLAVHQLTPELALAVAGAERVFFVDARVERLDEGICSERVMAEADGGGLSTHAGTPQALLHLAACLYDAHPEAWLFSIPARQLDVGAACSAGCRAWIEQVVREIEDRTEAVEGNCHVPV
jgi:hydrogenase maturation protease